MWCYDESEKCCRRGKVVSSFVKDVSQCAKRDRQVLDDGGTTKGGKYEGQGAG